MVEKANISDIIRVMMGENGYDMNDIAKLLDKPVQSIRNKFSYDRFNIKEILLMLQLMDYKMQFADESGQSSVYIVSPEAYLNEDDLEQCKTIRNSKLNKQLSSLDEFLYNIPQGMKKEILDELEEKIKSIRNE